MLRLVLTAFLFIGASLYGMANAYNVLSYYVQDTCAGSPNRVDVEIQSECTAGCQTDNTDWVSRDAACTRNYKTALWESFGGADFILQEAFTIDCGSLLGASAFLASGECEQGISGWGSTAYVIAQLYADDSASIRYFSDDKCTTSLREPVRLTESIQTQDSVIDSARLDDTNVSCDVNGYRWSSYKSSSSIETRELWSFDKCENSTDTVGCNSSTGIVESGSSSTNTASKTLGRDDSNSTAAISTASSYATAGPVNMIICTIAVVIAVVLVALALIYHRFKANTESDEETTEPRLCARSVSAYLDQNSPATKHQRAARTPRQLTETRKTRL